ncbi:MAG TPA: ABC transporter substrate-binding protein [Candidatus Bathyarchaeia archaeon]|nr:ABC transporter substrate-binding protein [Candidatus Bathyarchaeia archaeon]
MRATKRKTIWQLAAVFLALATGPGEAQTVDGVAVDADAELVVAVPDDTNNMDPRIGMGSTRSNYIRQVFESLVDVDPQGKPVPGLALAWKPLSDLTWEFTLRRGVTFHNGEPFNADTVLFNLDRMFRRNLEKSGIKDVTAGQAFEKIYPAVTHWEKAGDYAVRIHTSEPVPNLWDVLGREPLVPREYTIKNGVEALNEKPVGTGPFKMVAWKRSDSMRFERNEGYWGSPPLFKRLRFQVIPEAGGRLAALRAGQVAIVDAVPPIDAGVLGREPSIKVSSAVQKLYCRVYLNARPKDKFDSGGKDGLFGDPRVRLALNHAVNKDGIVQKIFHGYAQANASPVATVAYGYAAQEPYAYDVKRARALLAEAGWKDPGPDGALKKDGETLTLQLLFPAKHYGQGFDETTPAVAEMLKAVGVQVVIKPVDYGTLIQTVTKGTLPYNGGFTACRTSNNLDADDYVRDWMAITLINWAPYPPDLAELYRSTRREVDPQKRLKLLADLQHRVRDWAPVVELYQEVKIYAASARVLRFTPLTDLHMDFRGVALRK